MISDEDFPKIIDNAEHLTSLVRRLRNDPNSNEIELRALRAISDIWELLNLIRAVQKPLQDASLLLKAVKPNGNI